MPDKQDEGRTTVTIEQGGVSVFVSVTGGGSNGSVDTLAALKRDRIEIKVSEFGDGVYTFQRQGPQGQETQGPIVGAVSVINNANGTAATEYWEVVTKSSDYAVFELLANTVFGTNGAEMLHWHRRADEGVTEPPLRYLINEEIVEHEGARIETANWVHACARGADGKYPP